MRRLLVTVDLRLVGEKLRGFEMMTPLFLKPGVSGPLPVHVGKTLATIGAAICLTLHEDELPVTCFVTMTLNFYRDLF